MSPRRLYVDNAATSWPKPKTVHEAMAHYATELGASAGRARTPPPLRRAN